MKDIITHFRNSSKKVSSFIPYSATVLTLTVIMNYVWGHVFEGWIYHEWDRFFIQYSLLSYESPVIGTIASGSWLARGWQLWHLYVLWFAITLCIYTVAGGLSLFLYRKKRNFIEYRKIIILSSVASLVMGCISALFFSRML